MTSVRKYKFRVLDKKTGTLVYWDGFYNESANQNPGAVEQFTGIYDSNGVEVYEGDIVETNDGDHWGVVIYEENSFDIDNETCAILGSIEPFRVLGNIHQHGQIIESLKNRDNRDEK